MMDMSTLYEITDIRKVSPPDRMALIGLLEAVPGGMQVYEPGRRGQFVELTDDNFEIEGDRITVYADGGMLVFTPIAPDEEPDVILLSTENYAGLVDACL